MCVFFNDLFILEIKISFIFGQKGEEEKKKEKKNERLIVEWDNT